MANKKANKDSPIYHFLRSFTKGAVILKQLSQDDSQVWELLETITLEFILYNLKDEEAKQFLDLLESPSPSCDPLVFAQEKISDFEKRLIKEIKEKLKGIIES